MAFVIDLAAVRDADAISAVRNASADDLTLRHGRGPWSGHGTERGVAADMGHSMVYAAWNNGRVVGTFVLQTRKPWAIDRRYFTACERPMYLTGMAIAPDMQRLGIGRLCIEAAKTVTRNFPAEAIFLDAWDADAGAGEFYAKCGFREGARASYRGAPLI